MTAILAVVVGVVCSSGVLRKFGAHPACTAIDQAVTEDGELSSSPARPDEAYELTQKSHSAIILQSTFVHIGSLAHAGGQQPSPVGRAWNMFILISAVLAAVYITKVARRAPTRKIGPPKTNSTNAER